MRPIGYMAKHVSPRTAWLNAERVTNIYSVSTCISAPFADYINFWKHNGYWLFDSPQIIRGLAAEYAIDLSGTQLFYYEAHESEWDDTARAWRSFRPDPSFRTDTAAPAEKRLEGFDVVTFSSGTMPECSPLSCNSLASEVPTNPHCLLPTLEQAKDLLEHGAFENTEPGPYRIIAVHTVPPERWP